MTTTGRRCEAQTRSGDPCAAYAGEGSDYCFWHDPALAEDRKVARQRGGQARHGRNVIPPTGGEAVEIRQVGDVLPLLERAINDVLVLENSIARARAIGYLAGVAIKTLEISELAERVAELERVLRKRAE